MGVCLAKLPHSCGTRQGLQVFEKEDGSVDGYCFSCGSYIPNPYGEPKDAKDIPKAERTGKTEAEILTEMAEISQLGCVDLPDRKLRAVALDHYGIKVGFSEADGKTPNIVFFPYTEEGKIVKYKVKLLENGRVWSVGTSNNVDLFGWEQAVASGAKRLIIVEGEFDAPALTRIIDIYTKGDYSDYKPAVVSVPNGAGNAARDIGRVLPKVRKFFKDISLAFDMDEVGRKAVEEVCKICPEAKVIDLPAKDANECLIKGMGKAAHKAVTFNAAKPKNTRLVWGRDIHEKAKEPPRWGLSWPWEGMTEMTRGIRYGETIYIGAGEKMGKSEVVNAIGSHLITEHGLKIMLAKPEEANAKTYKLLNSKVVGKIFHDPKVAFDEDAYEKGGAIIKDHVCMLNLYQNISWSVLKGDIYAAAAEGIKAVFIDPITNLTNGMSSGEINEHLQGVAQDLAVIAKDLDIVIFIFCHLNKPPKGTTPWDRGGKITTDYFAGSSAMARSCNYAIGMEGNKDPELPDEEKNLRTLVLLADREFGESGNVQLYWNKKNGLFTEV